MSPKAYLYSTPCMRLALHFIILRSHFLPERTVKARTVYFAGRNYKDATVQNTKAEKSGVDNKKLTSTENAPITSI